MAQASSYQRAMVLVTGTSLLVPVVGLATAPLLTHALGVAGRGEAGAAMAPNLLIVGGATLGLPQALTYYLAKRPEHTKAALAWATAVAVVLGLLTLGGVWFARGYLSDGDLGLAQLMVVGTWLALPALVVGLLRGAATGRQLWGAVAIERALNSILRVILLAVLAGTGHLDVVNAVLVMCLAPVVAGFAYVGLRKPADAILTDPATTGVLNDLLGFGVKVWLGSVATMLMARMSQLLVTPLSSVEQLGLLLVAITISDVPYIVTQTIREVSFGVNSAESDSDRMTTTSRVTTLLAVSGSFVLAASLPFWIGFVFGQGFTGAIVPTWLLLISSCLAVPGLIAGAVLDSVGKPGLKSAALAVALLTNVAGLLLLTPPLGAVGAALAALVSTLASTVFMVVASARALHVPALSFVLTERRDIDVLVATLRNVRQLLPSRKAP